MLLGSPGQSSPLLASLPVPGRPLQPQLDLKHFFPFRLGCSSPVSLFPNFNAMDPVQKAVINHTFGVPQPLRKKQIISCNICHLRFNSTNQAEAHYKGHKHARKLKAMEAQKSKQRNLGASAGRKRAPRDRERAKAGVPEASAPPMDGVRGTDQGVKPEPSRPKESSVALAPPGAPQGSPGELPGTAIEAGSRGPAGREEEPCAEADGEPGKKKHQQQQQQHLHCAVCKLTVNSTSQLEAHNSGSKHKLMLEGQSAQPRRRGKVAASRVARKPKRPSGKGAVRVLGKSFRCDLCEIDVNSETQLKQHMNSRRHKDRLAGKAPRSKFGAYGKGPQSSLLATKLALHKQLTKGLTASFLPSPLSPTALCTMAASPLALRHPAGAATLVQSPLLSPALFRPAPGPLRATHASVIFSPY